MTHHRHLSALSGAGQKPSPLPFPQVTKDEVNTELIIHAHKIARSLSQTEKNKNPPPGLRNLASFRKWSRPQAKTQVSFTVSGMCSTVH